MARTRGCIWLLAGLIVAVLAGLVTFVTLRQAAARTEVSAQINPGTTVSIVVASQAIPVRALIKPEMVTIKEVPVQVAPQGALSDTAGAIGKVTLVDLVPGEILLSERLIDPNLTTGNGRYALIVAQDEVLMAFPAGDLMSRTGVLKAGDKVDLLFSLDFPADRNTGATTQTGGNNKELATFNLLQNVSIAAVVSQQSSEAGAETAASALLLTISPQDALTLKYVKDAGGIVDIVLRAPGADQEYAVDPVDIDRVINEYGIPLGAGR